MRPPRLWAVIVFGMTIGIDFCDTDDNCKGQMEVSDG